MCYKKLKVRNFLNSLFGMSLFIQLLSFMYSFLKPHFFEIQVVGPKILETPAHFISSPRPTLRRKKCPRTNKENLDYQDILPRTTLSSVDQNHGRGKSHAARSSLLKHLKGNPECNGPTIGV